MTGFERLKEQMEGQEDVALNQTVDYLLTRKDMETSYLKEEKTIKGMCDFIKGKGRKHLNNGWTYVPDNVVYAWAIMYFSLPNSFLKITENKEIKKTKKENKVANKNNIVSLEEAKQKIENKKEIEQMSFFGGDSK